MGEVPRGGPPSSIDGETDQQRRLRESEARLQAAVHLAKLGCYTWKPQTGELEWDAALRAMWGLAPEAVVDFAVWRSGVDSRDLARVEAAMARCVDPDGDGVYDVEYRVIGKDDGALRWIATRGQTHFVNGEAVLFFGVAQDVTARKRVEIELERQVETQVEQRETAEASVRQLQRLHAIGQITSGVVHDFNNLLSVVLTNVRLLALKPRDEDDAEGLLLIEAAADRGAKLIAQLLAFSRKEALEPQVIDLNDEVAGMSDLLQVTLGRGVRVVLDLAEDLEKALVDPTQLEMVVLNLAINARDAMPAGGELTLRTLNATIIEAATRPEAPIPGVYVCLCVEDTGFGMAEDLLLRILEPFFTTKASGQGAGLGLAQVFGFTKQSGGGMQIDSRVGAGTSVRVFFPCAAALKHGSKSAKVRRRPAARPRPSTKFLVLDDQTVLNSMHYAIETPPERISLALPAAGP